jgi:tRNA dimethylallyltransferase
VTDRVVALFGPTASGKTAVAVALAERLDGEVISADSMQVYRGLERLTNQPDEQERRGVPHHLLGCVEPSTAYDVATYAAAARAAVDDVLRRGRTPIVAGGSGLYLRAALADLDFPGRPSPDERAALTAEIASLEPSAAHARLTAIDPVAAARIAPADRRRIVRALELAAEGRSLAPAGDDRLWEDDTRHPTLLVALRVSRATLHARIDERTPLLLERGGVEEVRRLLAADPPPAATVLQAHGVADVAALLAGEIELPACVARLAARTRQYAKRQDTWRRRLRHAVDVDGEHEAGAIADEIARRLAR